MVGEWFRALQDSISTHVSGGGLENSFSGACSSGMYRLPCLSFVCASQAWESDEAIEEDMPESPVEKHDKDKEHRDVKKTRGLWTNANRKRRPPPLC